MGVRQHIFIMQQTGEGRKSRFLPVVQSRPIVGPSPAK